jgi:hypothetical protein
VEKHNTGIILFNDMMGRQLPPAVHTGSCDQQASQFTVSEKCPVTGHRSSIHDSSVHGRCELRT